MGLKSCYAVNRFGSYISPGIQSEPWKMASLGSVWHVSRQCLAESWEGAPVKRMPANFLETVGLECAIWPHLYWRRDMCETYVRSQDCGALRMCIAWLSGSLTRLSFLIGPNCSLALKGIGYFDLAKT